MTFIRYVIIQLVAYVVDIGVFLLALKVGLFSPIISNIFSKITAGTLAFVAHRNFTFNSNNSADRLHQAIRYFILLSLNVPLSSGILAFFLLFIDNQIIAKVLADVLSVMLIFWLSKSFVFVTKKNFEASFNEKKDSSV